MTKNRINHSAVTMHCCWEPHALVFVVMLTLSFVASQPAQAQSEPAYTFSVLHTFNGTNGANPEGALIMDAEGNLYSTTYDGGNVGCFNTGGFAGCGTVFKLDKTGEQTMLYKFPGSVAHGNNPKVGLVADKAGNLYGTTLDGGPNDYGTVFKLDRAGKETELYRFTGGKDGGNPNAFLIFDAEESNLYGTTAAGGDVQCHTPFNVDGCGVVFRVNKTSGKETVLYTFELDKGGATPIAALIMDAEGNLYGTTAVGGDLSCTDHRFAGCGVVFKLDKAGNETVLHAFTGGDGFLPGAALYMDKAGNLYSTTLYGGTNNYGTVFKLQGGQGDRAVQLHRAYRWRSPGWWFD
jgi:uncharacterized repeat protein (TIGR03803 family)